MVLANAWDNLRESSDFKFYELRKIKICDPLTNLSIQNIAISNNILFIATCDSLKVIVVPLVLEFEWSPTIQNVLLDTYSSVIIPLSIKPTYLTICGGKSGVLVVSGPLHTNPNQTQIQFFDLTDLNAVNSDLKPFATIDLAPANNDIIGLDWHPEYNESLFLAVLASGALISVGVNLPRKQARILSILAQNEKITSVSWSPKGKQFVIGKENGQIIQIKHKDGCNFEEAKKINPDAELAGYEVNAIKWCFTQLFMVSYARVKSEKDFDVKHITVFAPPKAQPVFNNHAQLCIEQFRSGLRYKTDFVHLGCVILCSTSFSSEMGVLVCDDTEKAVHSWCQLMLADENRLDLPIIRNNQSLSKGLTLYLSDTKIFKIAENQTIGGKNCPLLMVISSEGILNNYYVTYPKLVCPAQLPTKQLEFQNVPPVQLPQSTATIQQVNVHQTPTKPPTTFSQNAQTTAPQAQQPQQPQLTNQQLQQLQQQKALEQAQQEKLLAQQIAQQKAKEAELQKEKERKQLMEENHAYLVAIEEEVTQFSRLVLDSKERHKKTNSQVIGKESDKRLLIEITKGLEFELKEIEEKFKNIDIELLENFLLENFVMAEDARSRVERDNDSKLKTLFRKKPLDPVTTRKLKEINNKTIYIETNLKEIDYILDQQWQDYIVSEKGQKQNVVHPVNLIFQHLARNHRTLNSMENELRILEPMLPWKDLNHKLNYRKQDIRKLTSNLRKNTINDESSLKVDENGVNDEQDDDLVHVYRFTKKSRQNLLRILDSRPEIPIKRSSLPVDINSAIMISAVSKAKEKLKLSKRHAERTQTIRHHPQQTLQPQRAQSSNLNKKITEQQQLLQQQKLAQTNRPMTQQVKATSTFVPPPVLNQQSVPSSTSRQPQTSQQQAMPSKPLSDKSIVPGKGEPFKFSFNQQLADQQNKPIPPIQFGATTQPKQTAVTKPAAKNFTSYSTTPGMFTVTGQQDSDAVDQASYKPDQLNLTFDKANLNLFSSTPIKNQQQKTETANKTAPPAFGSSHQTTTLTSKPVESVTTTKAPETSKQPMATVTSTTQQLSKPAEDKQKMSAPRYEDISPATTPNVDSNKSQQQTTKPIDTSTFSFNALANLSKMPISTTFVSTMNASITNPFLPATTSTSSFTTAPVNVLGNIQNIPKTTESSTATTTQSSFLSTKPLFGPALTTTTVANAPNQTLNFTSPASMSIFSPQQPAKDAQCTSLFGNNQTSLPPTNLFGTPSSAFGSSQSATTATSQPFGAITTTATSSSLAKTPAPSVFGMNALATPAATIGAMNLSTNKKDTLPPLTQTSTTQSSSMMQTPQSVLTPNQTTNIQSTNSAFSTSAIQPQSVTPQKAQQPMQSFGFGTMCGLGGKPNPENANKNPFGAVSLSTPPNTTSTSLFGSTTPATTQQQGLAFGSSFGSANQTQQPTSAFSSPFAAASTQSTFGSPPTFGTTPISTATSVFGNSSSMLNKPTFGFTATQPQQPTSVFGTSSQPQPQTTSLFQQPQQQSAFGSPPAFGAKPAFGAPATFGTAVQPGGFGSPPAFGSAPTFGSSPTSFASPQPVKTGFESFANANVPTFGSFSNASTSFEAIGQNQAQQQTSGFATFGSPNTSTGFGSPASNPQFGGSQFSERRA